ncbi:MAG: hypothetical protein HYT07_02050 [Candidatus Levybacteria bacterium]|nr:hypothetical protein [Candidatus Levybacteria bacterium]
MPIASERASNRKEQILESSPYLRRFLEIDRLRNRGDMVKWAEDLRELEEPILREIEARIGKNWEIILIPLGLSAEVFGLFENDAQADDRYKITRSLVLIGHEVGNQENVKLILEDVMVKCSRAGIFNSKLRGDRNRRRNAIDSTYATILTGSHIKSG